MKHQEYNAPKGTAYRNTRSKLETTKQIRSFTDLLQSNQSINISTLQFRQLPEVQFHLTASFSLVPLGL